MPTEPGVPTAPAETASPGRSASSRRTLMIVALAVAGAWILGLVALTVLSANPVTLNPKQIHHSDFVATATRAEADSPTILVRKEWKRSEDLGEVAVMNLDEARMPAGGDYLVPLMRVGPNRYLITPTTLPNEAPLIYPATPEAEAQLQKILEARE